MDVVLLIKAAVMGVVEGLTEFLPVSSTGHLILTSTLLGLHNDEIMKTFEVVIQSGAILAIVIVYWQLIVKTFGTLGSDANSRKLVTNIIVGFLPLFTGAAGYCPLYTLLGFSSRGSFHRTPQHATHHRGSQHKAS